MRTRSRPWPASASTRLRQCSAVSACPRRLSINRIAGTGARRTSSSMALQYAIVLSSELSPSTSTRSAPSRRANRTVGAPMASGRQCGLDVARDRLGLVGGRIALEHAAVAPDQELAEVPLDRIDAQEAALLV